MLKLNCCEQWGFTTEMTLQRHPELVNVHLDLINYISTLITKYAEVELQEHWQISPSYLHSILSCSSALL